MVHFFRINKVVKELDQTCHILMNGLLHEHMDNCEIMDCPCEDISDDKQVSKSREMSLLKRL